ncbi:LysR substrate-binding domain-containing protein [Pararhodobacter oceanensis]|uniref:LysR substrate-binding domain-containing protein n=1 Tax=Pararhodobacter oceanensis TaxID=2172121 RepID=UPI003A8DEA67
MTRAKGDPAWPLLISRLSLRHLHFVDKVAENGNILGAARALNISQPAVSRAVREVEKVLDVQLFERRARGVSLTPEGELFVLHARAILNEMRNAWQGITDLDRANTGQLAIGSLPNGASGPLPRVLMKVRQERPGIRISVYEGLYHHLVPGLRAGDLDFIIGRLNQHSPDDALATKRLFRQSWRVMARAGHPMAGAKNLRLADLMHLSWILPAPTAPIRQMIDALFLRDGLSIPEDRMEMGAVGVSRALLLHSDTVMFLPANTYRSDEDGGLMVALDVVFEQPDDDVGLFWRRGHQQTPVERYFLKQMHLAIEEMGLK